MQTPSRLSVSLVCALAFSVTIAGCASSSKAKTARSTTPAASQPPSATEPASTSRGCAGKAYVTNYDDGTVSVITTATGAVSAPIKVGTKPDGVVITPDGTHAYVANQGDNTVSDITTATGAVSRPITVGKQPTRMAITPDGTHAYVTNYGDDTVSVITTATGAVSAPIPVGHIPIRVAITPDGTHAYVANFGNKTVSVITTATGKVAPITVGNGPTGMAITPDGTHAYVTNAIDGTVSVITTATGAVSAPIKVGTAPTGVRITPDGTHAYVANFGAGTVSVIATKTRRWRHLSPSAKFQTAWKSRPTVPTHRPHDRSAVSVLTGAAGTGKSTLLAPLIAAIREQEGHVPIKALAPTGKAADRLKAVGVDGMTVHRALAAAGWYDWDLGIWRKHGTSQISADTLVIDECSMADISLLGTLFRAVDWHGVRRLIFVGDHYQLPRIGPGRPFFDFIMASPGQRTRPTSRRTPTWVDSTS